jgi:hypothetical protein
MGAAVIEEFFAGRGKSSLLDSAFRSYLKRMRGACAAPDLAGPSNDSGITIAPVAIYKREIHDERGHD